jgi:hypothetical protein
MMKLGTQKTIGLVVGLTFTAVVIAMIIYMVAGPQRVPVDMAWGDPPILYVCDTAPDFVQPGSPQFQKALAYWNDRGWTPKAIDSGPCTQLCRGMDIAGQETQVTCIPGAVVIDGMTGPYWTEGHLGVCVTSKLGETLGTTDWGHISIPPYLEPSINWEGGETEFLPKDAESFVLAHELGHCLAGLGHAMGAPMGCMAMATVPGHMMHENAYHAGWTDQDIPEAPKDW